MIEIYQVIKWVNLILQDLFRIHMQQVFPILDCHKPSTGFNKAEFPLV